MSDEHLTVDGMLNQAWASRKSFRQKNGGTTDARETFRLRSGGLERDAKALPAGVVTVAQGAHARLFSNSPRKLSQEQDTGHYHQDSDERHLAVPIEKQCKGSRIARRHARLV